VPGDGKKYYRRKENKIARLNDRNKYINKYLFFINISQIKCMEYI
jgi:hypothetical protein